MPRREIIRKVLPGGILFTNIKTYWMSHGGRRKGAGRPAIAPEDKRLRLSTTIKPETLAFLQKEAKEAYGLNPGRVIDCIVEMYRAQLKPIPEP